jgi:hypothetical protein
MITFVIEFGCFKFETLSEILKSLSGLIGSTKIKIDFIKKDLEKKLTFQEWEEPLSTLCTKFPGR